MKIIKPYFKILTEVNGDEVLKLLECVGRTCYKSENKITDNSARDFVKMLLLKGHESIIEHYTVSVRVICDRGVSHEIVRHRIASYAQESTRYCNYSKSKFGKEITVIEPCYLTPETAAYNVWRTACEMSEMYYFMLLEKGCSPQEARAVLPNSLKTEIVMTMNLREWRHFFKLRTSKAAHPQMREIAISMLEEFKLLIPVVFDDIIPEV